MTNRKRITILVALTLTFLTACGDDDDGGTPVKSTGGYYDVNEVRVGTDVYRCIHGSGTGEMWCENIGLGGNG